MSPLDPAVVGVLAPDGLDEGHLRSVAAQPDAALLANVARAAAESEARQAALWVELLRRGLPVPPVAGLSERLPEWTDRGLLDALGPFLADYDLHRRAALLVELRRRGLTPGAPRGPRHGPLRLMAALLVTVLLIGVAAAVALALRFVGGPAGWATLALSPLAFLLIDRVVRPWFQPREGDAP